MREAVGPHFFYPTLEQRGDVEPEKGELQYDNIGTAQTILLCGDVNGAVGVELIEAEHFGIGEMLFEVVENAEIGGGVVKIGVAADDEGVWHVLGDRGLVLAPERRGEGNEEGEDF